MIPIHFNQAPPRELLLGRELLVSNAVLLIVGLKWVVELSLEALNQRHLKSGGAPRAGRTVPDAERLAGEAQSLAYTSAKSRLHQVAATVDMIVLLLLLTSGVLPWLYRAFVSYWGLSIWTEAAFIFVALALASLPTLPLSWYLHFHLEQRFGFNTVTPLLWWTDRLKGALLAVLLGYPLLLLVLKMAKWAGPGWWVYAWAAAILFQLLIFLFAPVVILPLFNRFEPLPDGELKQRLLALAERTGFQTRSIQVMDGSKRSRHSNAFLTGFGRFRRIVLFDTLIGQLDNPQLEAVLAHEIGHFKKYHVAKTLVALAAGLLLGFFLLAQLAKRSWFLEAFRLPPSSMACALLLFALLAGPLTFWFSPLVNYLSRRFEFQADAYAVETMRDSGALLGALRKLEEKNLANPLPHPVYSRFYYSHPTLTERAAALQARSAGL